jgi:hypothetical protein
MEETYRIQLEYDMIIIYPDVTACTCMHRCGSYLRYRICLTNKYGSYALHSLKKYSVYDTDILIMIDLYYNILYISAISLLYY